MPKLVPAGQPTTNQQPPLRSTGTGTSTGPGTECAVALVASLTAPYLHLLSILIRVIRLLIALVFSKHPIHAEHLNAYGTRSEVSFQIWQKSAKVKTGCAKVKTGGAQALRTRCLSLVRRCQS